MSHSLSPGHIARRCWIKGRVQGVYYRASARDQARALKLSGYARNLPDGRVEVLAIGPVSAVEQMIAWLHRGPPAARVDQVEIELVQLHTLDDVAVEFVVQRD